MVEKYFHKPNILPCKWLQWNDEAQKCVVVNLGDHSLVQGGHRQKNIGEAAFGDDDIIISVTSFLLMNPAKILGGLQLTQPTS